MIEPLKMFFLFVQWSGKKYKFCRDHAVDGKSPGPLGTHEDDLYRLGGAFSSAAALFVVPAFSCVVGSALSVSAQSA